jgi:AraC-like DNA-binding protein
VFFCGAYDFRGRPLAADARFAPGRRSHAPAPGSTLRATMDLLGRRSSSDASASRRCSTAAGRRADPDPARALHSRRRGRAALVPRLRRSTHRARRCGRCTTIPPAWTVAELAGARNLSRSAFARRFTALLASLR